MKKIFSIALLGLMMVAFSSNASAFETDNIDIVYSISDFDTTVDAIVPVVSHSDFYVEFDSMDYKSSLRHTLNIATGIETYLYKPSDYGSSYNLNDLSNYIGKYLDKPIDYGSNYNSYLNELNEAIPDLTKYTNTILIKDIETNVGKFIK